jgi:hypothetical protein
MKTVTVVECEKVMVIHEETKIPSSVNDPSYCSQEGDKDFLVC